MVSRLRIPPPIHPAVLGAGGTVVNQTVRVLPLRNLDLGIEARSAVLSATLQKAQALGPVQEVCRGGGIKNFWNVQKAPCPVPLMAPPCVPKKDDPGGSLSLAG